MVNSLTIQAKQVINKVKIYKQIKIVENVDFDVIVGIPL